MDSENLDYTKNAYDKQKSNPDYQKLRQMAEVIGVWDDHDYGLNDGGNEWLLKDPKKDLLLDFLDEPLESDRWFHPGVFMNYVYPLNEDKTMDIYLLDGRSFRDKLSKARSINRRYDPNTYGEGTMLGEAQWYWLEKHLQKSTADITLIVSGIQVLSDEHSFEKWGNMPHEKDRLLNLLQTYPERRIIFLSGDRHIGEVSKTYLEGVDYAVFDVTSSGLTHSYENADEDNNLRISPLIDQKNYGILKITPKENSVEIEVELRGLKNTSFYTTTFTY
jgi:alkaline phosphatase D